MKSLFGQGYRGLSDTKFSGVRGSVYRSVGIDSRSEPGLLKAHQKLAKHSGETIDELCKTSVNVSDGSKLWFSSESGKIWREVEGTYSLVYTLDPVEDFDQTVAWDSYDQARVDPIKPVNKPTMWKVLDSDSINNYNSIFWLNPNNNIAPKLIKRDFQRLGGSSSTVSLTIDVPSGDDMAAIVIAGNYAGQTVSSATFGGDTMTTEGTVNATRSGVDYDYKIFSLTNLTSGENTVTATFNTSSSDRYLYVLIFENVSQTTPVASIESDNGTSDVAFILLPGTYADSIASANNQLGLLFTASQNSNHIPGTGQDLIIQSKLDDSPDEYTESISSLLFAPGEAKIISAIEAEVLESRYFDDNVIPNSISESSNSVYFTTSGAVFKIETRYLDSWSENIKTAGTFSEKSEYHPVVLQNNSLYFGDGSIIAQIDFFGTFVANTNFNLSTNETITALAPFDLDILVGTKIGNYGRVLRWDGLSETTSAEDIIYEKEGVLAFILDDNYVYPVAGKRGSIYYYNGARCEDFIDIPEVYGLDTIKVNNTAVGYYLGVPIVGISNDSGNPVLQGIYGYGSYNTNYAKSLSLDYPMPSGEFSGVEIGSILVDGTDLYVAWKDAEDTGVAKLDWTAKYDGAYMETINLTPAMNRHQAKTISEVMVPYYQLSKNTNITIGVDKDYGNDFDDMAVVNDTKRKFVKLKNPSVPDTVNPRLRIGLTVDNNSSPEIEDVLFNIAPVGNK